MEEGRRRARERGQGPCRCHSAPDPCRYSSDEQPRRRDRQHRPRQGGVARSQLLKAPAWMGYIPVHADDHRPRDPGESAERGPAAALQRGRGPVRGRRAPRPPPEKDAVARLIDRLQQLETQVATLGRVQSRMEAAQRQSLETMERFEVGQLRAGDAGRRRQPVVAPAILAGTLSAAAVVAVAWALGVFAFPVPRPPPPPATVESAPPEAKPATTE